MRLVRTRRHLDSVKSNWRAASYFEIAPTNAYAQLTMGARYVNLALGAWLTISAFLWHHSPSQFSNSWSVGSLCFVVAALARLTPPLRYGNTALGVWLLVSTPLLGGIDTPTAVNNILTAIAITSFSLLPRRRI